MMLYRDFVKQVSSDYRISFKVADQAVSALISKKIGKSEPMFLIKSNPNLSDDTIKYVDSEILRIFTA